MNALTSYLYRHMCTTVCVRSTLYALRTTLSTLAPSVELRGPTGTVFHALGQRAPKWMEERLALVRVLLCTIRFDGGMRTARVHAAVETDRE